MPPFKPSLNRLMAAGLVLSFFQAASAQPPPETTAVTALVQHPNGAAVPGAQVRLREATDQTIPHEFQGQTDEGGHYTAEDVPEGTYTLQIQAEGFAPYRQGDIEIVGREPITLTVTLLPLGRATGRLLAPDRTPVETQEVQIHFQRQSPGENRFFVGDVAATTEADGTFRWFVEPGEHQAAVRVTEVGYAVLPPFTAGPGQDVDLGEVRLQPFASVTGLVRAKATGQPLAGAQVSRFCFTEGVLSRWLLEAAVTTDAEGRFAMNDLWAGKWVISAQAPGYAGLSLPSPFMLGPGRSAEEVIFELQRMGSLKVRVLDGEGKPLPGSTVRLAWGDEQPTDGDGRYTFENLPPQEVELTARAPGFAPVKKSVAVPEGETVEVVVKVTYRGGAIRGTVRDADRDVPLAGVLIGAMEEMGVVGPRFETWIEPFFDRWGPEDFRLHRWHGQEHLETTTAADGTYTLLNVTEGRYTVFAIVDGPRNQAVKGVVVAENETATVNFDLTHRPKGVITGLLREPDGAPRPNTVISLSIHYRNGTMHAGDSCKTDAEGRFSFRAPDTGEHRITFTMEGFVPVERVLNVPADAPPEELDVQLTEENPPPAEPKKGMVTGRVFLSDGKTPAAGVAVALGQQSGEGFDQQGQPVLTDGEGRFRLADVPPGEQFVVAAPRGFWPDFTGTKEPALLAATATPGERFPLAEGGEAEVNVTLRRGGELRGQVVDSETGQPVPTARVQALSSLRRGPHFPGYGLQDDAPVDGEGRFHLLGLWPDVYTLPTSAEGYAYTRIGGFAVREGEVTAGIIIRLPRRHFGRIVGQVLLPNGEPAARAQINPAAFGPAATADDEGRFVLEQADVGEVHLTAFKPGYARTPGPAVTVVEGQTAEVTLTLRVGGTVAGRVADTAGQPLADVSVVALPPEGKVEWIRADRPRWWEGFVQAKTDGTGAYRLEHVAPRRTQWVVFDGRFLRAAQEANVPDGGMVTLDWEVPPARGPLAGRVTHGDAPVAGAQITISNDLLPRCLVQTTTNDEGRYALTDLPPGTYHVFCQAENLANRTVLDVAVDNEAPATVDFALTPGGRVTGQAQKADGTPLPGAFVSTWSAWGHSSEESQPTALSEVHTQADPDGRFTLEHLTPGRYTLYVWQEGYMETRLENVAVQEGETTDNVEIQVAEMGS